MKVEKALTTILDKYRDSEREDFLLATAMFEKDAAVEMAQVLGEDDFTSLERQQLWRSIITALGGFGDYDAVVVSDIASEAYNIPRGKVAEIWKAYTEGAFHPCTWKYHAKRLKELTARRKVAASVASLVSENTSLEAFEEAVQKAFEEQRTDNGGIMLKDAVKARFAEIAEHKEGTEGLEVPWRALMDITGTIPDGAFVIVGGRTSHGKTALLLNWALNVAKERRVLLVSLEMSVRALVDRAIASQAGLNSWALRTGRVSYQNLMKVASALDDRQLVIYESGDASVTSIAHAVAMTKAKAVFVDYLQLLKSPYKTRSREEEVAGISRALQRLAHQAEIPIVCAAQLRRPREGKDEKPGLYELRESGAIENDADIVILVWHDKTHRQGFVDLRVSVEKARHGPTGVAMLKFDKDRQLITDGIRTES